jgi:hypothetical protein
MGQKTGETEIDKKSIPRLELVIGLCLLFHFGPRQKFSLQKDFNFT